MPSDPYLTKIQLGPRGFFPSIKTSVSPSNVWDRPILGDLLEDEVVLWSDVAATGLLGHPWIRAVPTMWGSSLWDVAFTDKRFVAVELPLVGLMKHWWKFYAVPWSAVDKTELAFYMAFHPGTLFKVQAQTSRKTFRLLYSGLHMLETKRILQEVCPNLSVKSGVFRPI